MLTYSQSTGSLTGLPGSPTVAGYSGTGAGRNNPAMQAVANVGPIPQGVYEIGLPYYDGHLGPKVMALTPQPGTETFGRSLFRIHGNNAVNDASHGCIILPPWIRDQIGALPDADRFVTVTA
jgi:Tlde1 domain